MAGETCPLSPWNPGPFSRTVQWSVRERAIPRSTLYELVPDIGPTLGSQVFPYAKGSCSVAPSAWTFWGPTVMPREVWGFLHARPDSCPMLGLVRCQTFDQCFLLARPGFLSQPLHPSSLCWLAAVCLALLGCLSLQGLLESICGVSGVGS